MKQFILPILIVYILPVVINWIIGILYNLYTKRYSTIGELLTPYNDAMEDYELFCKFFMFFPCLNIMLPISFVLIAIIAIITYILRKILPYTWFIQNVWNRKIK